MSRLIQIYTLYPPFQIDEKFDQTVFDMLLSKICRLLYVCGVCVSVNAFVCGGEGGGEEWLH